MAKASISGSLTRAEVTDVAGFVNAANVPKLPVSASPFYCGFWIRFLFVSSQTAMHDAAVLKQTITTNTGMIPNKPTTLAALSTFDSWPWPARIEDHRNSSALNVTLLNSEL
jgi:hypothetical protein